MYGYVYMTTNQINGKVYFGQAKGRFRPKYLGSGKILARAISKYGREQFLVNKVLEAETFEQLNFLEMECIARYRNLLPGNIYNITAGGAGKRCPATEEQKRKTSRALSGRVFSEETRRRMLISRRLRKHSISKEARQRLSALFKGRKISEEQKEKIRKTMTGRKYSAERVEKVRAALKGKPWTKARRDAQLRRSWINRPVELQVLQ